MDRADEITLQIERKLCSFCCDRLYDTPKAEPCSDCVDPGLFEKPEREAVAAIIRAALVDGQQASKE